MISLLGCSQTPYRPWPCPPLGPLGAQESRAAAKDAVAKATALREKEASAFATESSEFKTNIAAMKKATAAISQGMGGAFLQTSAGSVLKQLSITMDISSVDRDMLTAFLTRSEYAPASGQIVGILKAMKDDMDAELNFFFDITI